MHNEYGIPHLPLSCGCFGFEMAAGDVVITGDVTVGPDVDGVWA